MVARYDDWAVTNWRLDNCKQSKDELISAQKANLSTKSTRLDNTFSYILTLTKRVKTQNNYPSTQLM